MRAGLLGFAVLAVLALAAPLAAAQAGPTVVTYTIPIQFSMEANGTVPAANGTPGIAMLSIPMPYNVSPAADVYLSYRLLDANGTLLSSADGVTIELLDAATNTSIARVYLASGSPAEAIVPLAVSIGFSGLSAVITNNLSSDIIADIEVIVIDAAEFDVSVPNEKVTVYEGEQATVQVTIKQVSGPGGSLRLTVQAPNGLAASVSPQSAITAPGRTITATVALKALSSGEYTVEVKGYFTPDLGDLPVQPREYTFATISLPVTAVVGSGAAGFALGAWAGATWGWVAVAAAIIMLIALVAVKLA